MTDPNNTTVDFIRQIVIDDNESGKHKGRVHTRFPPEPNGYLHIGHAKSICLNFGIAQEFGGKCNLRLDDTNPVTEDTEYVDSIREDVRWLGFQWDGEYYASDYFDHLYDYALQLIKLGKAYVCHLTPDQVSEYRGPWNAPGRESPYRNRSVEENLELFEKMRAGAFKDGECTLRAKIDMASSNMNLRDPAIYRIRHAHHHRTGDKWCIYPMYDFAHGFSDSIEGITHSICTLEFEHHRPLYDWFIDQVGCFHPQQIEFARLNLTYTVLSKRKLLELVKEKRVAGWDDPRMPTIRGYRRRGYTPEAIRNFCKHVGVTKYNSLTDFHLMEESCREHLNKVALRRMAILKPLKVVIENFPEDKVELREAINNPEDATAGTRHIPFTREIYIEQDDFMENPPKDFYRLGPGREVRLRYAYFLKCQSVIKDPVTGAVTELRCTYDPETAGGKAPDGRKVQGTIHWVSASHAKSAEVRLFNHLFTLEDANAIPEGDDWRNYLNPESLIVLKDAKVEPALAEAHTGDRFQFERTGYFCVDPIDSTSDKLVFNRTVTLKDQWAKAQKKK